MLKVLAITGSPRPKGHTATLLSAFLQGAETGGAQLKQIDACKLRIHGCTGCNVCGQTGQCILQDDMSSVFELLGEADLIVLASPIFYGHQRPTKIIGGPLPNLLESALQAKTSCSVTPKKRRGYFLCTGGAPNRKGNNFKPAIETATYFFDALDAHYLGALTVSDTDRVPVAERPELLAKAHHLGLQMTKGGSV